MDWRRRLRNLVGGMDELSDRARAGLRRVRPLQGPLMIAAYRSYGTPDRLRLSGRVLRDEGYAAPSETDPAWRNLVELYKRMESDEVPGARLRARFAGSEREIVADAEGYFHEELALDPPLTTSGWHEVELELVEPPLAPGITVRAAARVLVPPPSARFGVISDIDDTVVWTHVTSKRRMLSLLARTNAHTRKPFKGVAAFYAALRAGAGGAEANPIFYVSGSPWNLHAPLAEFMRVQGIPDGPLLLKDFGDHTLFGLREQATHKLDHIDRILRAYPHLPFVLIGDSGEQDPEIYSQVVHAHPNRVRVIYIRNVNPDPARIEAIDRLVAEVSPTGAQLVLAPDSEYAAVHAAGEGMIAREALAAVRADKRADTRGAET